MNHPLNNMGYQNLRQRLMTVLRKLDEYLDIKIQKESKTKVWSLRFKWHGEMEDTVYVKKTKEELVQLLKVILLEKPEMTLKELKEYCFNEDVADFNFEEHNL